MRTGIVVSLNEADRRRLEAVAALAEPRAEPHVAEPTAPTPENVSPAMTSETSRASVEPRTGGTTDGATRQRF